MPPELLQKLGEFQDELDKLRTATEEIKAAGKIANESSELSGKILKTFSSLIEPTSKLVEKIEKVDFPIRLDKLDVAITSINAGMNNLIQRTDSIEKEIKEKIENKIAETNNIVKSAIEKQNIEVEKQNAQIKFLKILSIITLVVLVVTLVFLIVK